MKSFFKIFGIIALVAVIGFSFAACGDDGGGESNQFVGSWSGYDTGGDYMIMTATSSTWTATWPGVEGWGPFSGTYTYSGNTATLYISGEGYAGTATVSGNTMTGMIAGFGFTLYK
jgi:hypothetical protein